MPVGEVIVMQYPTSCVCVCVCVCVCLVFRGGGKVVRARWLPVNPKHEVRMLHRPAKTSVAAYLCTSPTQL